MKRKRTHDMMPFGFSKTEGRSVKLTHPVQYLQAGEQYKIKNQSDYRITASRCTYMRKHFGWDIKVKNGIATRYK